MVEDGNETMLGTGHPVRCHQRWIDPCLTQAACLVALCAISCVETFPDDLGIRRGHRTGADGSPSNLAGIVDVTAESTAVEKKISTRPKGKK